MAKLSAFKYKLFYCCILLLVKCYTVLSLSDKSGTEERMFPPSGKYPIVESSNKWLRTEGNDQGHVSDPRAALVRTLLDTANEGSSSHTAQTTRAQGTTGCFPGVVQVPSEMLFSSLVLG